MLRLKIIDDGKVVADKKSDNIDDFDDIYKDTKIKYSGKKLRWN